MATEAAIGIAARGDYNPPASATMHHEGDATLYRPRAAAQVEADERRQAARSVIRLALGRHACPALASHPKPCLDPRHKDDVRDAREVLQTCGLADHEPVTQLRCSTCHRRKAVSQFAKSNETCKPCLSAKKAAREAGMT